MIPYGEFPVAVKARLKVDAKVLYTVYLFILHLCVCWCFCFRCCYRHSFRHTPGQARATRDCMVLQQLLTKMAAGHVILMTSLLALSTAQSTGGRRSSGASVDFQLIKLASK